MRKIVVAKCYVEDFWHKCLVKKQNLAKTSKVWSNIDQSSMFDQTFDFLTKISICAKTHILPRPTSAYVDYLKPGYV